MRIDDDEREFREAVASGMTVAEAAKYAGVAPHAVKYFTRRLPKVTQTAPPVPVVKPVAVPQPVAPPVVSVTQADFDGDFEEEDTDIDE